MKLDPPVNNNYAAVVIKVKAINELPNCDNVVGIPALGYQAIVSKDVKVGDIGIIFPAEVQLSDDFCRMNNLYRHGEKNVDPNVKGYIEDSRRVKAMRFRKQQSDCLFMPLSSLDYISGNSITEKNVGDVFDTINGHEICRKYVIKEPSTRVEKNKQKAKESRVDAKHFPLHFDTDQYWRNQDYVPDNADVVITAKLHGTSIRVSNTLVKRNLKWYERIAKKLGVAVKEYDYDYIFGSRRVTKDPNNPNQDHFYLEDIYTREGSKLQGLLPKGFIVFGELVGWVSPGSPIQKNYTYDIQEGLTELYVYRIAQINPDGYIVDLSWDQVKEFCRDIGIKHVPELARGKHAELKDFIASMMDVRFNDIGFKDCPPLAKGLVDEGCVIRTGGLSPYLLKAKSPLFLQHETKLLDQNVVDLESQA